MDFVCACVTPAQANDYFDDYFTVKIFDILGINWREERVMVINDDKGGLIFFRIKGKEEREREESKGEKSRRNSAFLLWESCAITLPWELPVATPLRLCPSSFLLPADRRISHDPPLSLSFEPIPLARVRQGTPAQPFLESGEPDGSGGSVRLIVGTTP